MISRSEEPNNPNELYIHVGTSADTMSEEEAERLIAEDADTRSRIQIVSKCHDHAEANHSNDDVMLIGQRWLAESVCGLLVKHDDPLHDEVTAAFTAYCLWCHTHGADKVGWKAWSNDVPLSVRCVLHDDERLRLAHTRPVLSALCSLYSADRPSEYRSDMEDLSEALETWQRLREEV